MILTERRSIERWLEVILDDCTRDICRALLLNYLTEEKAVFEEEESLVAPVKLSLYMRRCRPMRHV
jgi:hypothetical protein